MISAWPGPLAGAGQLARRIEPGSGLEGQDRDRLLGSRGRKEHCYLGVEDSSEPLPWLL